MLARLCLAILLASIQLHRARCVVEGEEGDMVDTSCAEDGDCAYKGVCVNGRCNCFGDNCPGTVWYRCGFADGSGVEDKCVPTPKEVVVRTGGRSIVCNHKYGVCTCPSSDKHKCHKHDLAVHIIVQPEDSPYENDVFSVTCCVNMDPRNTVENMYLVHNNTIEYTTMSSPYDRQEGKKEEEIAIDKCWKYELQRVKMRDSGEYKCVAEKTYKGGKVGSESVAVRVRAPISVQVVNSTAMNASSLYFHWETSPTKMAPVNIRLVLTKDESRIIRRQENLYADQVTFTNLLPFTFYTLVVKTVRKRDDHLPAHHEARLRTQQWYPSAPVPKLVATTDLIVRRSCRVMWLPPENVNGILTHYELTFTGHVRHNIELSSSPSAPHRPPSSSEECRNLHNVTLSQHGIDDCVFDGLWPNRDYVASIKAFNGAGGSKVAHFPTTCQTDFGPPSPVPRPMITLGENERNKTVVRVNFLERPDETNGTISCYYMAIVPLPLNGTVAQLPSPDSIDFTDFDNVVRNNLRTATRTRWYAYIAESMATLPSYVNIGDGEDSMVEQCPVIYEGRFEPTDRVLENYVMYTGFMIVRVESDATLDRTSRGKTLTEKEQAAFIRRRKRERQGPLPNAKYGFSAYFKPTKLFSSGHFDDGQSPSMILTSLVLFLLLLVVAVVTVMALLYTHRRQSLKQLLCIDRRAQRPIDAVIGNRSDKITSSSASSAIVMDHIPEVYIEKHRDQDLQFSDDFDRLPHFKKQETTASDMKENARKNRYNDIKAYDVSRVRLLPTLGLSHTDYINANHVEGYMNRKRFIAAQGPLAETIGDFWRMVWQQEVRVIVMVTNLNERFRAQCMKYWPEEGGVLIDGRLQTRLVAHECYADYSVRQIQLTQEPETTQESYIDNVSEHIYDTVASNGRRAIPSSPTKSYRPPMSPGAASNTANASLLQQFPVDDSVMEEGGQSSRPTTAASTTTNEGNTRLVTQYHYTGWGDYRAPDSTNGLLRFLMRLRQLPEYNNTPVVVHCSAGVGRTGTLIAVDVLLDQCLQENKADVFGVVSQLRKQRNFMVQSLEQYVFVYKALAEWVQFGETDISIDRLPGHVRHLLSTGGPAAPHPSSTTPLLGTLPQTRMAMEFLRLGRTLEQSGESEWAMKEPHLNRSQIVVPFDRNRVVLAPVPGLPDCSYINASTMRGYFYPYILTQDPLPSTRLHFWRMVQQENVQCIVMMGDEHAVGEEERYWPARQGESVEFGDGSNNDITVTLGQEEEHTVYKVRELIYTSRSSANQRRVMQFVYTDWGPGDTPSSPGSLLHLLARVIKVQSSAGSATAAPMLVHCRDGASRSGVYMVLSLLLARVQAESCIDVFQTVKTMQAQRSHCVHSESQYRFVYQTMLEYLQHAFPS